MKSFLPDDISAEVLSEITPTKDEIRLQKSVIDTIRNALVEVAAEQGYEYDIIEAQGSTGRKQTQLKGKADIDLFVGLHTQRHDEIISFPIKERKPAISRLLDNLVENWFIPAVSKLNTRKMRKTYSEHPYLSLKIENLDVDILCYFALSKKHLADEGPITAVDRTVHHSRYIVDQMTDSKRENARLLKSFVRACHAYGDRCAVGRLGFTGYSLELISVWSDDLGTAFERLVNLEISSIDPKERSFSHLKEIPAFRDDFIFIIDPTDTNRNVASSFDPRSYRWIKERARELMTAIERGDKHRILRLMLESSVPINPPPERLSPHLHSWEFVSDESTHYTVLRDKLHRLAKKIATALKTEVTGEKRFGDTITEIYFEGDRYALGVFVEQPVVSDEYERRGPPVQLEQAGEEFKKHNPVYFERDGYLWTIEKRKWTSAWSLVSEVLSQSSIKGITLSPKSENVSTKVLNVLFSMVLPIERSIITQK